MQVLKKCTDLDLSLLYILILGTYGKFARRNYFLHSALHAWALAACLPRQDHVYITTDKLFYFYNDEFDEIPYKPDSTENQRLFEKYSTAP